MKPIRCTPSGSKNYETHVTYTIKIDIHQDDVRAVHS